MNFGFDEFRGFMGGNVDYHTHIAGYGLKQLDGWNNRELKNEPGYTTDVLRRYATNFIARNKDKPFFLGLDHAAPHDPWQGRDSASTNSQAQIYREIIEALDGSVGEVVEALREHHLETNTLLIFCSHNGAAAPRGAPANGRLRGRTGSKIDSGMSEGGHRVPFIAAWPGVIPPGRTSGEVVTTMDLLPTFAKLAGAGSPVGHQVDGLDVMPVLNGGAGDPGRVMHLSFGDEWAVRNGAWKLTGKGNEALTLVNLETDLTEKENHLIEKPDLAGELMNLHRQWVVQDCNQ